MSTRGIVYAARALQGTRNGAEGCGQRITVRRALGIPCLAMLIAACGGPTQTIRVPGPVEYRDRIVVQPVRPELLRDHPIATGDIAVCPQVAAARKAELLACNADKAAIRATQEGKTP